MSMWLYYYELRTYSMEDGTVYPGEGKETDSSHTLRGYTCLDLRLPPPSSSGWAKFAEGEWGGGPLEERKKKDPLSAYFSP